MIRIDPQTMCAVSGERRVRLTRGEFLLAQFLSGHPEWVRSHAQIMDAMGVDLNVTDQAVCATVHRLRVKLRRLGEDPIGTVYGVGYYWANLNAYQPRTIATTGASIIAQPNSSIEPSISLRKRGGDGG